MYLPTEHHYAKVFSSQRKPIKFQRALIDQGFDHQSSFHHLGILNEHFNLLTYSFSICQSSNQLWSMMNIDYVWSITSSMTNNWQTLFDHFIIIIIIIITIIYWYCFYFYYCYWFILNISFYHWLCRRIGWWDIFVSGNPCFWP